MKLFSTMTVGLIASLTVLSIPSTQLNQDSLRQLKSGDTSAKPFALIKRNARPRVVAELDVHQILNALQTQVSLQKPAEQPVAANNNVAAATVKGIKQVDVVSETSQTTYAIPNGDVFLDRSAVGELAPADDTVR